MSVISMASKLSDKSPTQLLNVRSFYCPYSNKTMSEMFVCFTTKTHLH